MTTYLLAWNAERWPWSDLPEMAAAVRAGETVSTRWGWGCGHSKRLQAGDRAFLIRLGKRPKGIVASGIIVKGSFEALHWDEAYAAVGRTMRYVEVQLDRLLEPGIDRILPRDLLKAPPLGEMHWDTQMSGIRIPAPVASGLEEIWKDFTPVRK